MYLKVKLCNGECYYINKNILTRGLSDTSDGRHLMALIRQAGLLNVKLVQKLPTSVRQNERPPFFDVAH